MDFHSLVRKDLQALCKLNKIPANRTNIAMAEALNSLKIVKGIEKFCGSSESSSVAESSVESPEKNVVTSPKTTRTGRRKQVREGSGIVQTVTPVTRRRNKVPVASVKTVQRVYNTRLSARLSKNKVLELEKKDCTEAVKISSYCDVVSDNDFGEVSEDKECSEAIKISLLCDGICVNDCGEVSDGKGLLGSDNNVGLDLPISEIEQQSESLNWKNADKDLDSNETAATTLKSQVLKNNVEGFQMDTVEAVVEMPSQGKMAVVDMALRKKKDDVGVDLCLYETEIITEVLANEGEVFRMDTEMAEVETPAHERKAAIPVLSVQEKGSVDIGFSFSETELQSETLKRDNGENLDDDITGSTGSHNVGVDFSPSEFQQPSESLNSKYADRDLDSKDTTATNLKSEVLINKVEGFQVDTVKDVVDMPSYDNKAVVDMLVHKMKDDVVVDLSFSEIDMTTEVPTNEVQVLKMGTETDETKAVIQLSPQKKGSDDVGVEFSLSETELVIESTKRENDKNLDAELTGSTDMKGEVLNTTGSDVGVVLSLCETEQQIKSLNWKNADRALDSKDIAATNLKSEVVIDKVEGFQMVTLKPIGEMPSHENKSVVNMPLHKVKGSDNVGVYLSLPEIEQQSESLDLRNAKDLDSEDTAATNLKSKVLINKVERFQMDIVEAAVEMQRHDNMGAVVMPLHKKKDDVGIDLCFSETDIITEVLPNEVEVFQIDTEEAVVETPAHERKAAIPILSVQEKGSVDGKNLDDEVTGSTDMKAEALNGHGSHNAGVNFPLSEIERSESFKSKYADRDLNSKDTAATNLKSEVLINKVEGSQMEIEKTPIHKTKAVVQILSPEKKGSDEVGVDFFFSETKLLVKSSKRENYENLDAEVTGSTDMKGEVSNSRGSDNVGVDLFLSETKQTESLNWKNADTVLESKDTAATNLKSEVLIDKVEGFQMVNLQPEGEMPSLDSKALVDMPHHKMKDMTTEVLAHEVKVHVRNAVANVLSSLQQKGPDDVGVDFSFSENELQIESSKSEKDENLDADVTGSTDIEVLNSKGDKDRLDDDPESSSETYDNNSCETEADLDFPEYVICAKQLDKIESIVSQILVGSYTKEYADQSETPDSFDSSVGSSSGIATYYQLDSGKSFTKESRLHVASDVSSCCFGIKRMSLDGSQKASEIKSPSSLKPSGKICPSSAPLQARSLQKRRHTKDMPVSSTTIGPTFKLTSTVSDGKENIEQNERKVEFTKEKAYKNDCEKYEAGLHVRSPKKLAKI